MRLKSIENVQQASCCKIKKLKYQIKIDLDRISSLKMYDQIEAKIRRLSIWFAINLIIFISCYLNYCLQLKHRYLYRTLSVGLCLSRAAAMVINFNLVLVWIPMCKYTLTRLAVLATEYNNRQKVKLNYLISKAGPPSQATCHAFDQREHQSISATIESGRAIDGTSTSKLMWRSLIRKLRMAVDHSIFRIQRILCEIRIGTINSFLIAVDHSTSLHTISATTITMASVIHTVAHLMNVINFSKNYDPLLSDLNMAEYRGQNPLQLLVSVPGLTGCFMILILILMSLSSIGAIRNSSFDLFQVFHRLSILFVIFLVIHPFSHVLKEQINVDRHNPEICYDEMVRLRDEILHSRANLSSTFAEDGRTKVLDSSPIASSSSSVGENKRVGQRAQNWRPATIEQGTSPSPQRPSRMQVTDLPGYEGPPNDLDTVDISHSSRFKPTNDNSPCQEILPKFVAQSSLCWYVLGTGLSCYLMDLILRRLRRNRNSVELLGCRSDDAGNLIELTLSNNHKRFARWLPGQFVYLNCPQISRYEWHPFTISSMNDETSQFTLHIKTGGDWTRKLRHELELINHHDYRQRLVIGNSRKGGNSMSLFSRRNFYSIEQCYNSYSFGKSQEQSAVSHPKQKQILEMAKFDRMDHWSSRAKSQCTLLSSRAFDAVEEGAREFNERVKINLDSVRGGDVVGPNTIACRPSFDSDPSLDHDLSSRAHKCTKYSHPSPKLDLYVDGPFHSPFERLLKQQVSVCIANGVGWTAFSSVFQHITSNEGSYTSKNMKCNSMVCELRGQKANRSNNLESGSIKVNSSHLMPILDTIGKLPVTTKLHLMVIVTSIEQLKPFFSIVMKYFDHIRFLSEEKRLQADNYIREVTAYITRANKYDVEVTEFCHDARLNLSKGDEKSLPINETFMIIFGRPNFDTYLAKFTDIYADKRKISIYCCGSYEVKKSVANICHNLNRNRIGSAQTNLRPTYCYHEENF